MSSISAKKNMVLNKYFIIIYNLRDIFLSLRLANKITKFKIGQTMNTLIKPHVTRGCRSRRFQFDL